MDNSLFNGLSGVNSSHGGGSGGHRSGGGGGHRWLVAIALLLSTVCLSGESSAGPLVLAPEFTGVLYINVPATPKFVVGISGRFTYEVREDARTNRISLSLSRQVKTNESVNSTIGSPVAGVRSEAVGNPARQITIHFNIVPSERSNIEYTVGKSDYGILVQFRRAAR